MVNLVKSIIFFLLLNCYSQDVIIKKVIIFNLTKDDSIFLKKSNNKCVNKYIKNDFSRINIYYKNPIVKDDSITLKINNKIIFNERVKLDPSKNFPFYLGSISTGTLKNDNNTISLNIYDYNIKYIFELKHLKNIEAIEIKPIINKINIRKSSLYIYLRKVDIFKLYKVKLCNLVYRYTPHTKQNHDKKVPKLEL